MTRIRPRVTVRYATMEARKIGRRVDNLTRALDAEVASLDALAAVQTERIGVDPGRDAALIDAFTLVDVVEDSSAVSGVRWRWLGTRNNVGTPVIRVGRHELSARKWIAEHLGVARKGAAPQPDVGHQDDVCPFNFEPCGLGENTP